MAADTPELRSWVQHVAQAIRRVYVQYRLLKTVPPMDGTLHGVLIPV